MAETIDFNRLIDHLKVSMSHKQITEATGINELRPDEMQKLFEDAQALLDLHFKVCPDLHNLESLAITYK